MLVCKTSQNTNQRMSFCKTNLIQITEHKYHFVRPIEHKCHFVRPTENECQFVRPTEHINIIL